MQETDAVVQDFFVMETLLLPSQSVFIHFENSHLEPKLCLNLEPSESFYIGPDIAMFLASLSYMHTFSIVLWWKIDLCNWTCLVSRKLQISPNTLTTPFYNMSIKLRAALVEACQKLTLMGWCSLGAGQVLWRVSSLTAQHLCPVLQAGLQFS